MQCPNCSSETWDNAEKVAGGWKGPLRKCKDKSCGWVLWPPKGDKKSAPAKAVNGSHGPKWTWPQLSALYRNSLLVARKHVVGALPNAAPADVIAATATVFIAASRDGVKEPVKEQPLTERPKQLDANDDETEALPF